MNNAITQIMSQGLTEKQSEEILELESKGEYKYNHQLSISYAAIVYKNDNNDVYVFRFDGSTAKNPKTIKLRIA